MKSGVRHWFGPETDALASSNLIPHKNETILP